jgi:ABC-type nitrate/sulfonate/bicarbonate transport system permease component
MESIVTLPTALFNTLMTLLLGGIPATIVGLVLGAVLGLNAIVCEIAKRVLQIPASLPAVLLLPFLLLAFRRNDPIPGLVVFFSMVWMVAIYTAIGVQRAMQKKQVAQAIPDITLGIRFGLMLAWSALIVSGMLLAGGQDIGFYIWDLYNEGSADASRKILGAALSVMMLAFLIDQIVDVGGIVLKRALSSSTPSPLDPSVSEENADRSAE